MDLKTKYIEKINEEKQGRELYFEEIPTKEEREQLKANGYRWNNNKKCWYIKTTKGDGKKAKKCNIDIKGLKLNELIELTEAEKEKFCNDVWNWGRRKMEK